MKLRNRLICLFLMVSIIPLVLCCAFLVSYSANTTKSTLNKYFSTFTQNAAQTVGAFFEQKIAIVESLARFDATQEHQWEDLRAPFTSIVKSGVFEKIILTKKDGTYFNTGGENPYLDNMQTSDNSSPNATKSSIAGRDYFKRIVTNNTGNKDIAMISEPVLSLSNGVRQFMVCKTIFNQNNELNGIVAGSISFQLFADELNIVENLAKSTFGTNIKIMVIDENGLIVYHWDDAKMIHVKEVAGKKETAASYIADLPSDFQAYAKQMSALEKTNVAIEYELDGKDMLFSFYPIAGTAMSLGLFIDKNVLLTTLKTQLSTSALFVLVTSLVIAAIAIIFARRVIKPLQNIANILGGLSTGSGNLTLRLPVQSNDVIARISGNFNKFSGKLHDIISIIQREAEELDNVSTNLQENVKTTKSALQVITAHTNDLSQNAGDLSTSIESATSTVDGMGKTILALGSQIATQSRSVNDSSAAIEQMVANIQSVSNNLERANKTFANLKVSSETGLTTMETVIESIKSTAQYSQQMLETNDMIDSIASQTNLLAMNAAIEAAHAGDAGKGFSVVADEIRKLAEDSSEQSKKIAEVLHMVVGNIETVVQQSNNANVAFEEISSQIGNVSGLMAEIALSMKEQSEGSQQVLESLKNIQTITSQILDGSEKMTNGAELIHKEMLNLRDFAYKVKDVTQSVSMQMDKINTSVDSVADLSDKNNDLSESLIGQTKGFEL